MVASTPIGTVLSFLILATPTIVLGTVGSARLATLLGYSDYRTSFLHSYAVTCTGIVLGGSFLSGTDLGLLLFLPAMLVPVIGGYAATRNVTDTSHGWLLGLSLVALTMIITRWSGITLAISETTEMLLVEHLLPFYLLGLFLTGAIGAFIARALRGRGS